jgi:hypothetical protein
MCAPLRGSLLAVFVVTAGLPPRATADVVTFDTAGDLATHFNLNGTSGYYAEQAAGGVGNSRAVAAGQAAGDATGVLKTTSFDATTSTNPVTVSMVFKLQSNPALTDAVQLGIVGNATDQLMTTFVPSMSVAVQQQTTNGATQTTAFLAARATNASGAQLFTPLTGASSMTLDFAHFYRLTATVNPSGVLAALLEDFGTTGATDLGTVPGGSGTANVGNFDLLGDPTVFAAFRTPPNGGAQTLDTFTATSPVPEPSALALLGVIAAGTCVTGRMRRARAAARAR